jgi:hypothetical protein
MTDGDQMKATLIDAVKAAFTKEAAAGRLWGAAKLIVAVDAIEAGDWDCVSEYLDEYELGAAEFLNTAVPVPPGTLTDAQLNDACLSYDHAYGMHIPGQQALLRHQARLWWTALRRAVFEPPVKP